VHIGHLKKVCVTRHRLAVQIVITDTQAQRKDISADRLEFVVYGDDRGISFAIQQCSFVARKPQLRGTAQLVVDLGFALGNLHAETRAQDFVIIDAKSATVSIGLFPVFTDNIGILPHLYRPE